MKNKFVDYLKENYMDPEQAKCPTSIQQFILIAKLSILSTVL